MADKKDKTNKKKTPITPPKKKAAENKNPSSKSKLDKKKQKSRQKAKIVPDSEKVYPVEYVMGSGELKATLNDAPENKEFPVLSEPVTKEAAFLLDIKEAFNKLKETEKGELHVVTDVETEESGIVTGNEQLTKEYRYDKKTKLYLLKKEYTRDDYEKLVKKGKGEPEKVKSQEEIEPSTSLMGNDELIKAILKDHSDIQRGKEKLGESERKLAETIAKEFLKLGEAIIDTHKQYWDLIQEDALDMGEKMVGTYNAVGAEANTENIAVMTVAYQSAAIKNMRQAYSSFNQEAASVGHAPGWTMSEEMGHITSMTISDMASLEWLISKDKNLKAPLNYTQRSSYSRD